MTDFRLMIYEGKGLPNDWVESVFALEWEAFGGKYERCPSSPKDLAERYACDGLVAVAIQLDFTLVGIRIFTPLLDHSMESRAMMVSGKHRGKGYAGLLCLFGSHYLRSNGIRWITSWTHHSLGVSKILAEHAPYYSTDPELKGIELELLRAVEGRENKPAGTYGDRRTVPSFYRMKDSSRGDADFWVHDLGRAEP